MWFRPVREDHDHARRGRHPPWPIDRASAATARRRTTGSRRRRAPKVQIDTLGSGRRRGAGWASRRPSLLCSVVLPGGCPSGQRERSVKSPATPTEVRILPLPRTHRPPPPTTHPPPTGQRRPTTSERTKRTNHRPAIQEGSTFSSKNSGPADHREERVSGCRSGHAQHSVTSLTSPVDGRSRTGVVGSRTGHLQRSRLAGRMRGSRTVVELSPEPSGPATDGWGLRDLLFQVGEGRLELGIPTLQKQVPVEGDPDVGDDAAPFEDRAICQAGDRDRVHERRPG